MKVPWLVYDIIGILGILVFPKALSSSFSVLDSPVLWRESPDPVASSYIKLYHRIVFSSPCGVIANQFIHPLKLPATTLQCMNLYQRKFIDPLKALCGNHHNNNNKFAALTHEKQRKKRAAFFIPLISAIFNGVANSVTTKVIGGKTSSTETEFLTKEDFRKYENGRTLQNTLNFQNAIQHLNKNRFDVVDNQSKDKSAVDARIGRLEASVNELSSNISELWKSHRKLQTNFVDASFLISQLSLRIEEAHKILQSAIQQLKQKNRMPIEFFKYFDYTLPCGSDCPLEQANLQQCQISKDGQSGIFEYNVPVVNKTLIAAKADPFRLMHKSNGETCTVEYNGPKTVIASTLHNCVLYEDHSDHDEMFHQESKCVQNLKNSQNDVNNFFEIRDCVASKENDAWDFLQVKKAGEHKYVYCYGNEISFSRDSEPKKCPAEVFMIYENTNFWINGQELTKSWFLKDSKEEQKFSKLIPDNVGRSSWFMKTKLDMELLFKQRLHARMYSWMAIVGGTLIIVIGLAIRLTCVCFGRKSNTNAIPQPYSQVQVNDFEANPYGPYYEPHAKY